MTQHDYKTDAFTSKRSADAVNYQFIKSKISKDKTPNKVYKVVSLPGENPTWEKNLEKAIPEAKFEFHGVESNAFLWFNMASSYAAAGKNYIACQQNEGDLEEFIRSHRDFEADIVYCDLMNGTGDKDWELYELMVEYNFLAKDALIMHTMHLRRNSAATLGVEVEKLRNVDYSPEIMRNLCEVTFVKGETNGVLMDEGKPYRAIPKLMYTKLRKAGINATVNSAVIYRTRSNRVTPTPMVQILCQRMS